jgi:hypothetical protein
VRRSLTVLKRSTLRCSCTYSASSKLSPSRTREHDVRRLAELEHAPVGRQVLDEVVAVEGHDPDDPGALAEVVQDRGQVVRVHALAFARGRKRIGTDRSESPFTLAAV